MIDQSGKPPALARAQRPIMSHVVRSASYSCMAEVSYYTITTLERIWEVLHAFRLADVLLKSLNASCYCSGILFTNLLICRRENISKETEPEPGRLATPRCRTRGKWIILDRRG
jgi:hypothetical protein